MLSVGLLRFALVLLLYLLYPERVVRPSGRYVLDRRVAAERVGYAGLRRRSAFVVRAFAAVGGAVAVRRAGSPAERFADASGQARPGVARPDITSSALDDIGICAYWWHGNGLACQKCRTVGADFGAGFSWVVLGF